MSNESTLGTLAWHFALLSLFAIGGANAALPEMHRLAVGVMGWMSDKQFADMYALAQMSPGPNMLIVTLIGYHVAGAAGAVITTAAMCGPPSIFAFWFARVWDRFRTAKWRLVLEAGLVPVSVSLVAASAYVVARAAAHSLGSVAVIAATAAIALVTRINPLWAFVAAAALGLLGAV